MVSRRVAVRRPWRGKVCARVRRGHHGRFVLDATGGRVALRLLPMRHNLAYGPGAIAGVAGALLGRGARD